jgi:dTDP-glucose 4,6-dehydratase
MRALITGGMGFIGSNFVKLHLAGRLTGFNKITVLDKMTYAGRGANFTRQDLENFELVIGDIADPRASMNLIQNSDVVINFAAESHVDRSIGNAENFVHSNILGVQVLLDNLKRCDGKKFIQISTDEVYGTIEKGSWDEQEPLMPNSPYAASKASADLICLAYAKTYGLNINITRCSNNFGYWQHPEKLIPLAITNLLTGKRVPVYGDGSNVREWIDVKDHCKAIQNVIDFAPNLEVYNVGSGYHLTNLEIVRQIIDYMGLSRDRIEFVQDRLGHDFRYSVNSNKIRKISPDISYSEITKALPKIIDWYSENTNWWTPLASQQID